MNYEEKYNQALERAREFMTNKGVAPNADAFKTAKELTETIFPELRELEDERIRKAIVKMISDIDGGFPFEKHGIIKKKALAWLEKQGEKSVDESEPKFIPGECIRYRGENYKIKDIEKTKNGFIYNVSIIGKPSDPEEVKTAIGFAAEKDMVKIEQKQGWSEEDERMCQETIDWFEKKCFPYALENENPTRESIKWLKSLKDRVQPQIKQEWGEKDEKMFDKLYEILYIYGYSSHPEIDLSSNEAINLIYWLKSLKPKHWKPSKEQMEALNKAKNSPANYYDTKLSLQSLYNDLKKL